MLDTEVPHKGVGRKKDAAKALILQPLVCNQDRIPGTFDYSSAGVEMVCVCTFGFL